MGVISYIPQSFEGTLLCLRQFLATESSLRMLTVKALFVPKILKFLL